MDTAPPDFESIKHTNPYGAEYWSARELAPLLGYQSWQKFAGAVGRASTACASVGEVVADHFIGADKMVRLGSGAERAVPDYWLSRYACYLIAQNGDPRKREIAAAQTYFAVSTRAHEVAQLYAEQQQRLQLRERVSENNRKLAAAARAAGVLSPQFGAFQNAGYRGLYGGLDVAALKAQKGIAPEEEVLDRMGRAELAANDFRITQTEEVLRKQQIRSEARATRTHYAVGKKVRHAIADRRKPRPEPPSAPAAAGPTQGRLDL